MITSFIINLIFGLVSVITIPIKNLPDVAMSGDFASSITTANGYISSLNTFIPVDTIIQILGVFLVIEGAVLTYKLIMWVIKRLPTQS